MYSANTEVREVVSYIGKVKGDSWLFGEVILPLRIPHLFKILLFERIERFCSFSTIEIPL